MKKLYLLTALLLVGMAPAVNAQSPDSTKNGISIVDTGGREIILFESNDAGSRDLSVSVLGIKLDFVKRARKEPKVTFDILDHWKFGFAQLKTPDYSMYPSGTKKFMSMEKWESFEASIALIDIKIALNERRNLSFSTGLHLKDYNFTLTDRIRLIRENGMLAYEPVPDSERRYKSTSFDVLYLTVPAMVRLDVGKNFFVSGGLYLDIMGQQRLHTRKPTDIRIRDYGMKALHLGASLEVGFDQLFIYGEYGLTDMFRKNAGPKTKPYAFGLGWQLASW